jgi:hypothetical protein
MQTEKRLSQSRCSAPWSGKEGQPDLEWTPGLRQQNGDSLRFTADDCTAARLREKAVKDLSSFGNAMFHKITQVRSGDTREVSAQRRSHSIGP